MSKKFDFSGWVTKNDIQCSDGVTIRHDAFRTSDGQYVPLVWQHDYKSPSNVLGKILLHNTDEGVYGYGFLNDTEMAQDTKKLLRHGDVNAMSIGARKIQKNGQDVIHGEIYEVSLVLKGANPGAVIEHVLQHSAYGEDTIDETMATIYPDVRQNLLLHAEKGENMATVGEVIETLTEDQAAIVERGLEVGFDNLDEVESEVLETLTEEQIQAVGIVMEGLAEMADEDNDDETDEDEYEEEDDDDDDENEDEEEDDDEEIEQGYDFTGGDVLKHNAFYGQPEEDYLTHEDVDTLVMEAVESRTGSLSAVLRHNGIETEDNDVLQHGISNIDVLFPAATLQRGIQAYNPNAMNVEKIMGKFSASTNSKIKNIYADLTDDIARARGYIKGNEKVDVNLVKLFYRETTPQTIYHRTAIDRDDVIDIQENGIDSVAFLKQIQSSKFKQEILNAALFSDGRQAVVKGKPNPDKIDEGHIRPITTDDDLFTIKLTSTNWETVIDDVLMTIPSYQGSGNPSLLINPFDLAKLRILKDKNGRYLYGPSADANRPASNQDIAAHFGCSEVLEYRDMPQGKFLIGNLADYVFGTSRGGQVATFDHFDIDFNQMKYLMEARLCGAILIPKAFIFVTVTNADERPTNLEFDGKALKQHPYWGQDSAKTKQEPGKQYKSKMSEPEKPASPGSSEPGSPGIGG